MPVNIGSNTKDHRAFITIGGEPRGEMEEISSPEIAADNSVKFRKPGSAFESSGGAVFSIDDLEGQRHWNRDADLAWHQDFIRAAAKGVQLAGTIAFHEILSDGTVRAEPDVTVNVLQTKSKRPDVNTSSEDALHEVAFEVDGEPIL